MAIVVVISFLPAFVFMSAGLKALPEGSDDLFNVLVAGRLKRFIYLAAPSAVPSWMIALRLAAPPAVLSAMVAEFLMGTFGWGIHFAPRWPISTATAPLAPAWWRRSCRSPASASHPWHKCYVA